MLLPRPLLERAPVCSSELFAERSAFFIARGRPNPRVLAALSQTLFRTTAFCGTACCGRAACNTQVRSTVVA
jgi:hypothetical protein